jgi:D-amino peptidase
MKVFISVDIEGCAGVFDGHMLSPEGHDYAEGRALMVGECNAAVQGALDAGATEVYVNDSHNRMINLLPWAVHPEARLILGSVKPMSMCQGLDSSFDAAMYIGYHARQGTAQAFLCHTYHSRVFYNIAVNGEDWGESSLNAAMAGWFGVPVVFVSGDDACAAEISRLLPGTHTLSVKRGQGSRTGDSLHPEKARALIRQGAAKALEQRAAIRPFRPVPPYHLVADLVNERMADLCTRIPKVERTGARRLEFISDNYQEMYRAMLCMLTVGGSVL